MNYNLTTPFKGTGSFYWTALNGKVSVGSQGNRQ